MTRDELTKALEMVLQAMKDRHEDFMPNVRIIYANGFWRYSKGEELLFAAHNSDEFADFMLGMPWEGKTIAELPAGRWYKRRVDDECWLYICITDGGGLEFARVTRNDVKSYAGHILQSDLAATDWQPCDGVGKGGAS